ncbi:MAG TPA: ABC transporter permease subunit [Gemmataceae bacterium]|jgi:ABC-2 type transport system permease protein|nr:ABC transporter permease subunit [Gemmataceae bacterium]
MTGALVGKLFRDVRLPLVAVIVLLLGFQCLWVKITARITGELVPVFMGLATAKQMLPVDVEDILFQGPGQIVRTLMGGERIQLDRAMDILSVGYVHPLMVAIFCIWGIGRAAGAVAGEIDRGTMELLVAQPLPRWRVILAHFCVDLVIIPVLCLALWAGTWLGVWLVGPIEVPADILKKYPFALHVDPAALGVDVTACGAGLWNVGALIFAVSGYTMWLSACGRFRGRVLGLAVFVTLVQFLVNVVGQLWDAMAPVRPFTVFYYYQPQQIILAGRWSVDVGGVAVNVIAVLLAVGAAGYALALWTFCRRDLPAPL